MVVRAEDMVQRPLNYTLIDEVDSILIDEAHYSSDCFWSSKVLKQINYISWRITWLNHWIKGRLYY